MFLFFFGVNIKHMKIDKILERGDLSNNKCNCTLRTAQCFEISLSKQLEQIERERSGDGAPRKYHLQHSLLRIGT